MLFSALEFQIFYYQLMIKIPPNHVTFLLNSSISRHIYIVLEKVWPSKVPTLAHCDSVLSPCIVFKTTGLCGNRHCNKAIDTDVMLSSLFNNFYVVVCALWKIVVSRSENIAWKFRRSLMWWYTASVASHSLQHKTLNTK